MLRTGRIMVAEDKRPDPHSLRTERGSIPDILVCVTSLPTPNPRTVVRRFTCLVLLCMPALAQDAAQRVLTLEQASGRAETPSFARRATTAKWAPTGKHVVLGKGDEVRWLNVETLEEGPPPAAEPEAEAEAEAQAEAEPEEVVEVEAEAAAEPEAESESESEAEPEPPTREQVAEALETLDGIDAKRATKLAHRPRAKSADGSVQVMERDGRLVFFQRHEGTDYVGEVGPAEGPFELLDVADGGGIAGWVKDGDLHLLNTRSGDLIRVTDTGSDEFFNGKLDWVYQEEVYGRGDFKAFWFAPDGERVAYLALDESAVHPYTVVDHIEKDTFQVKAEVSNYPKVGDPNPVVSLGIATTADGKTTWVDLSEYDGQEFLIVRVGWYPDGRLLFMVQDRIQTWCDVNLADPKTGKVTRLLREQSKTWTERPAMPRFLEDGDFLWMSARTGKEHVYRYDKEGKSSYAVTEGDWSVRRIVEVVEDDEGAGLLYFNASEGGATNTNLYRVGLDGEGFKRLTRGPGTHRVSFNPDKTFMLDRVSALDLPEEIRLCDGDGDLIKKLSSAGPSEAEQEGFALAAWEVHEVAARDGFLLDAAVLKPVPFDETASYPVWLSTYSGPDAPSVRNRWDASPWNQFLAQNGVIVLQVNVRSASGKGHDVIGTCYKQLGVQELADLEDTVDWLCANPWADGGRVGITGYSFGGFMSAYALLVSDKFVLGVAGGGVYDWRMYDTIYTERYMSTPELNLEGYKKTSCLEHAKGLSGFLHMHHGVMDDNVHFQNMMQMAYALQRAGQTNWSMMAYPQNRHGIRDREQRWHARQLEWGLIREHLRPTTAHDRTAAAAEQAFDEALGSGGE
jgi:dipeptidyl-peptidase 4